MSLVSLNTSADIYTRVTNSTPHDIRAENSQFSSNGVSRRRFLQTIGTVAAFLCCGSVRAARAFSVARDGLIAQLSCGDVALWSIDASWLAGDPRLDVVHNGDVISIALRGARYPGTDISADFLAEIFDGNDTPLLRLSHALACEPSEAPLLSWLAAEKSLSFTEKAPNLSAKAGQFLKVSQHGPAIISISPTLALRANAIQGWQIAGSEFTGNASSVTLSRPSEPRLIIAEDSLLSSQLCIDASTGDGVRMHPKMSVKPHFTIHDSSLSNIRVELAETKQGIRYSGFLSQGVGITLVTGQEASSAQHSRVLARDPLYGRVVSHTGDGHAKWSALQGRSTTPFGNHMLVSGALEEGRTIDIESHGDTCTVNCVAYPHSVAIASDAEVGITIRFPDSRTDAAESALQQICPFSFRPKELPLDGAEVVFKRPATALLLKFRFEGFKLRRSWRGLRLITSKDCRLFLLTGSQSLIEQAILEEPSTEMEPATGRDVAYEQWLGELYDRSGADPAGKASFIGQRRDMYKNSVSRGKTETINFPGKARVSGESQLVYRLREGMNAEEKELLSKLSLKLEHLLNLRLWQLVVVRDACSSECAREKIGYPTQNDKSYPPIDATFFEIPGSLFISPNEEGRLLPKGLDGDTTSSYRDIFRLVADTSAAPEGIPLRAIGARGFSQAAVKLPRHFDPSTPFDPDPIGFRTALDMRDRVEFVWLTSQWGFNAIYGTRDVRVPRTKEDDCTSAPIPEIPSGSPGIYVPKPFHAKTLMLSSLGGSMKSLGTWDPPSLFNRFALSVERWEHCSTFARAHHDEVVYKGFLLPTGHRAALIKVTQREERRYPDIGVVSMPIQRFFIELSNPEAEYSEFLAPHKGRTWPFRHIRLLLKGRLQIENPTDSDLCQFGQSAFKVCVGEKGYPFQFEFDRDPKRRGSACMVFIDNTVAHDRDAMQKVAYAFNGLAESDWPTDGPDVCGPPTGEGSTYSMRLLGSKVQYAPSKNKDDTSYVTEKMLVKLGFHKDLVNSAIVEASGKPPTYPEMYEADIVIPAINRLTAKQGTPTTKVDFADLFREVGFDEAKPADKQANTSEVFLRLKVPVQLSFSGRGDRSGAVATPNTEAHYLSRSIGLMGRTALSIAPPTTGGTLLANGQANSTVKFKPAELFNPNAKLLGVIPISSLFDAMGLDEIPRFVESVRHQVDAVGNQVQESVCKFADSAVKQLDEWEKVKYGGHTLAVMLSEFPALNPCRAAYTDFKQTVEDLNASTCGSGQFELDRASAAIGNAGRSLDKMRNCIENVAKNPALLLPAAVTELTTKWKERIDDLSKQHEGLVTLAKEIDSEIRQLVSNTLEAERNNVGSFVTDRLNHHCAELIHHAKQFSEQHLPTEQQVQSFVTLYNDFQEIFLDVLGWYEEMESYDGGSIATLTAIIDTFISQFQTPASPLYGARDRVNGKLETLDTALRSWPPEVLDNCRSFFRRTEPTITLFGNTIHELLDISSSNAHKTLSLVDDLRRALTELRLAVEQNRNQGIPKYEAYLASVGNDVKAVVDEMIDVISQLDSLQVANGAGSSTVRAALVQLENSLSNLGARAIPKVLNDVLNQSPSSDSLERVRAFLMLTSICLIAKTSSQSLALNFKQPDLVKNLILRLHEVIGDSSKGLCQLLIGWINILAPGQSTKPAWLELIEKSDRLLPEKTIEELDTVTIPSLRKARTLLEQWQRTELLSSDKFRGIVKAVNQIGHDSTRILQTLGHLIKAPDRALLETVLKEVEVLVRNLIPSEVRLDYTLTTTLKNGVSIFKPGTGTFAHGGKFDSSKIDPTKEAALSLMAEIVTNPVNSTSTSSFRGSIEWFHIDLNGFLKIKFDAVRFEALSGSGARLLPPEGVEAELTGCLAFVNKLKQCFSGKNGPYVVPLPNGIRAGYRFSPGMITIGAMIIQDLVLDVGIEVPFDDRAAVSTLAVSSRKEPALLFIAPYGGAMFFVIKMAGDRLVNVEASFEAGLIAAFDLGAVKGSGRVTMGIYYCQSAGQIALNGFFFAGGAATILEIVSMSVSLRIGLVSKEENVDGYGEFSVEIGSWPFEWTLSYSVQRNVKGGASSSSLLVANTIQEKAAMGTADTESNPYEVFTDPKKWKEFKSAFNMT